jgi:oligoribonuclease
MIDKHRLPIRLLWVDLEMSGLDAAHDFILEVAAEVTDFNFKSLASYHAGVRQDQEAVQLRMREQVWWQEVPELQHNLLHTSQAGKTSGTVERELLGIVKQYFGDEPVVLAGNSIHKDREFIRRWWPKLEQRLHYRMLDVSSLKVYMQGKYGIEFQKSDVHRAYDDIQASIAEWLYYMEWLQLNRVD